MSQRLRALRDRLPDVQSQGLNSAAGREWVTRVSTLLGHSAPNAASFFQATADGGTPESDESDDEQRLQMLARQLHEIIAAHDEEVLLSSAASRVESNNLAASPDPSISAAAHTDPLPAIPPKMLQHVKWFRLHGLRYWPYVLIATAVLAAPWLLPRLWHREPDVTATNEPTSVAEAGVEIPLMIVNQLDYEAQVGETGEYYLSRAASPLMEELADSGTVRIQPPIGSTPLMDFFPSSPERRSVP